jgi:hypothetical protein
MILFITTAVKTSNPTCVLIIHCLPCLKWYRNRGRHKFNYTSLCKWPLIFKKYVCCPLMHTDEVLKSENIWNTHHHMQCRAKTELDIYNYVTQK